MTTGNFQRATYKARILITLAQGIPFYYAGDDLLRSKDMDDSSFNSGDWFNKIDWSGKGDNWGIGLPIADMNQASWPIYQPLLANTALKPTPQTVATTADAFKEFLQIRYSTGLFRMSSLEEVQNNLSFLNTGPKRKRMF
jgi:pullulanase